MAEEKRISAGLSQLQTAFFGNWNSRAGKLFISIELSQIVCPRFFAKGRRSFFFGARNQFDHFYTKTLKMFLFMAFFKLLFFIYNKYVILPPVLHPFFVSRIHEEVQYNGEKIVNNSLFPVFNDQTFSVGQFIETGRKLTIS